MLVAKHECRGEKQLISDCPHPLVTFISSLGKWVIFMFTAQFTLTRECNASVNQSSWAQAVRQLGVPGHPVSPQWGRELCGEGSGTLTEGIPCTLTGLMLVLLGLSAYQTLWCPQCHFGACPSDESGVSHPLQLRCDEMQEGAEQ